MKRSLFSTAHEAFRETVRAFYTDCVEQVLTDFPQAEHAGAMPREFWLAAGELGLPGVQIPEEYGGAGRSGFLFNVILTEEARHLGIELDELRVHTDIAVPSILRLANCDQRMRWLPRMASGNAVAAFAMPQCDIQFDPGALATRAIRDRGRYIIFGAGVSIAPGSQPDLIIVPVRTDLSAGCDGLSLLVVDADSPRLSRSHNREHVEQQGGGSVGLTFDDVVVDSDNLLGEEGWGFDELLESTAQWSLSTAVRDLGTAAKALHGVLEVGWDSAAVDVPEFAECADGIENGQCALDGALLAHEQRPVTAAEAAHVSRLCTSVRDRAVQLQSGLMGDGRRVGVSAGHLSAHAGCSRLGFEYAPHFTFDRQSPSQSVRSEV